MENPFALIVLAAQKVLLIGKIPEDELAEQRLTIARALIASKRYNNEQIRRFLYFLKTFIHIDNQEINIKFEIEVNLLTGDKYAMGIIETIKMLEREQGERKGMEEGQKQKNLIIVTNLLLNTDFNSAKIAALADVPEEYVQHVRKQLEQ